MARASYDAPDASRRPTARRPPAARRAAWSRRSTAPTRSGATALQVFTDNPTAWRRRAEPPTELPAFRDRLAELDIGPGRDPRARTSSTWPAPTRTSASARSALLATSCGVAPAFGARFVNVHIGSHRGHVRRGRHGPPGRRRSARVLAEVDDAPDAAHARARELGRQRVRARDERRRAGRHRRGDRRARASPASGSGSASTPPTPGAPASTSRARRRSTPSWPTFDARIGLERLVDGPPQRLEVGARLACRPPRAPRGRPDRRRRAWRRS